LGVYVEEDLIFLGEDTKLVILEKVKEMTKVSVVDGRR
jgi:hypothetical protein